MKHSLSIFCLLIAITAVHPVQAREEPQKIFKNSVKLHTGSFSLGRFRFMGLTRLCGVSAERKLSKNFSASLGYFQWSRSAGWRFKEEMVEDPNARVGRGDLIARIGYAMLDLSAIYDINIHKRRHLLKAGGGLSYTWGENRNVAKDQQWSFYHGWVGPNDIHRVNYWGLVPQVSYEFLFLKNRMNVGMDVRGRFYIHVPKHQYDIGIHAGVNF